jgi:alpha-tubulin suppressor-like RCC1 family protein
LRLEPLAFPGEARITGISVGENHLLAMAGDGAVYGVGGNSRGQLGDGTRNDAPEPVRVRGLPEDEQIARVAAWAGHSVAVTAEGRLYAWGWNNYGQLGDGTDQDRLTPVAATGFPERDPIVEAYPSYSSTFALTTSGKLYLAGTLGAPAKEPEPKPGLRPVARFGGFPKGARIATVAVGDGHWLAAAEDGTAWAWGENGYSKLGVDPQVRFASRPMRVTGLPEGLRVVQVAAGESHSIALADDGSMCAWGGNDNGELGIGVDAGHRRHPAKIPWVE